MSETTTRPEPMTLLEEEEYLLLAFTSVEKGAAPATRELLTRSLDVRPLSVALAAAGYYDGREPLAYRALLQAGDRLIGKAQAVVLKPAEEGKLPPDGYYALTPLGARFALEVRAREVPST